MALASKSRRFFEPENPDDLSTTLHRQLVGWVAISLPAVVVLFSKWRPIDGLPHGRVLDSNSAYYYTPGIAAFVGSLGALAAFFVVYRGFNNKYRNTELRLAWTAAFAALVVATFPTKAPAQHLIPVWYQVWMSWAHFGGAALLFVVLTWFSWILFTKSEDDKEPARYSAKWWRNAIHKACAVVMAACIVWAAIAVQLDAPIFYPETLALIAFGTSWLVKGRVDTTLREIAK